MQNRDSKISSWQRTLTILWIALLTNIPLFYVLSTFARSSESQSAPNAILTIALSALGSFAVVVSFFIKQKFLRRSVDLQQIGLVQTGYIFAWAMCDTCAMLGLLDFFITRNKYYFVLFILAAIGIAVQFPRRNDLLAATYKASSV